MEEKQSNGKEISEQQRCKEIESNPDVGFGRRTRVRYVVVFLCFMSRSIAASQAVNMSVAILKMVKIPNENTTFQYSNGTNNTVMDLDPETYQGEFDWSPKVQGVLFTVTTAGCCFGRLLGGRAAEVFGFKVVIVISMLCSSVCNVLTPWVSRIDVDFLIVLQFIKGIGSGVAQSSSIYVLVAWIPREEMALMIAFVMCGLTFGSLIGTLLPGALCEIPFLNGWPLVFYAFGGFGILFSLVFNFALEEDPQNSPLVNENELKYILCNRALRASKRLKVPWKQLIFSVPSLALIYLSFTQGWVTGYLNTVHPTYMKNILEFTVGETGAITSSLFSAMMVSAAFFGYLSDVALKRKIFSVNCIRKLNSLASAVGVFGGFLGICFVGTRRDLNIFFFVVIAMFNALMCTSTFVIVVDMTSNFAGTLGGMCSFVGGAGGFLAPLFTGYITDKEQSYRQWRYVFMLASPLALSGGFFFQMFGSTNRQPWDFEKTETKRESVTETVDSKKPEEHT